MKSCRPSPTTVFLLLFAVLSVVVGIGLAKADEIVTPRFGGCILAAKNPQGAVCDPKKEKCECLLQAEPAAAVTVAKYESGKFSGGLLPGLGYGVALFPRRWYAVGAAAYFQLSVGGALPSAAALSGLLSFASYVRVGLGSTWTEQATGPLKRSTAYLFGLGSNFGSSP